MGYEEYDDEDAGGRPLWGRIGFLVLGLLLFFFLGRCTAGGASQGEVEDLRSEIAGLSAENQELVAANEARNAVGGVPSPGASTAASPGSSSEDATTDGGGGAQTYEVQPEDTLGEIAAEFCGDSEQFPLIEELNELGGQPLQVGQELEIPAECDQGTTDASSEESTEDATASEDATEESSEAAG